MFIYNNFNNKQHFIVFSYDNYYYSFNYTKKCFVSIDENILYSNIKNNKIGIYNEEDFEFIEKRVIL